LALGACVPPGQDVHSLRGSLNSNAGGAVVIITTRITHHGARGAQGWISTTAEPPAHRTESFFSWFQGKASSHTYPWWSTFVERASQTPPRHHVHGGRRFRVRGLRSRKSTGAQRIADTPAHQALRLPQGEGGEQGQVRARAPEGLLQGLRRRLLRARALQARASARTAARASASTGAGRCSARTAARASASTSTDAGRTSARPAARATASTGAGGKGQCKDCNRQFRQ
jgi:hypothetical protein